MRSEIKLWASSRIWTPDLFSVVNESLMLCIPKNEFKGYCPILDIRFELRCPGYSLSKNNRYQRQAAVPQHVVVVWAALAGEGDGSKSAGRVSSGEAWTACRLGAADRAQAVATRRERGEERRGGRDSVRSPSGSYQAAWTRLIAKLSKRNYAILACRMLLDYVLVALAWPGAAFTPLLSPPEYSRWLKNKWWYWRETSQTFSYRKLTSFVIFVC